MRLQGILNLKFYHNLMLSLNLVKKFHNIKHFALKTTSAIYIESHQNVTLSPPSITLQNYLQFILLLKYV